MKTLIVEDEPGTRLVLSQILKARGHEVTACESAEKAIEALEKDFHPLVLLDLLLPGINGIEFCQWLRQQPSGDRHYVLVGTSNSSPEDLQKILQAGANDYVSKPYQQSLLKIRLAIAEQQVVALAERKDLEDQLKQDKDFISAVVDTAAALIVVLSPKNQIIQANRAYCQLTGYPSEDLLGREFPSMLVSREDQPPVPSNFEDLKEANSVKVFENNIVLRDMSERVISWRASAVLDAFGNLAYVICAGVDITEYHLAEQRLAYLASRDPLTRLYNRSYLGESVQNAVERAMAGTLSALLYIDLDNFKIINDTSGHAAGDRLLVNIADLLRSATRERDIIVRFGGDEFVVVLNNVSLPDAKKIAERIRFLVDELVFLDSGKSFTVGSSIGLAVIDGQFTSEQVMGQADSACYAAKSRGRNRVEIFQMEAEELNQLRSDAGWRTRIKEGMKNREFKLHFQPVLCLRTGEIEYHEALLRLEGPDGGIFMPGIFLPAAERFKMMGDLDHYVLEESLRHLSEDPGLKLSINLSGQSLADAALADFLETAFAREGVDPKRVILEVTETEIISNLTLARALSDRLRAKGFRFALDDFGAGFSSFGQLKNLPVDYLKIDGIFIRELGREPTSRVFVGAINDIAHHLGMKSVAEYVQDRAGLEILRELGVDYAQGIFVGMAEKEPLKQSPEPAALG